MSLFDSLDLAEEVRQRADRTYVSNPRPEYCMPDGRSMVVYTKKACMQGEEPVFTFVVRDVPQSLRGIERIEGVRFYIKREGDER